MKLPVAYTMNRRGVSVPICPPKIKVLLASMPAARSFGPSKSSTRRTV
ncbi:MAG: hypothetical protein QM756_09675 [Polyangiaceae bacterium]